MLTAAVVKTEENLYKVSNGLRPPNYQKVMTGVT